MQACTESKCQHQLHLTLPQQAQSSGQEPWGAESQYTTWNVQGPTARGCPSRSTGPEVNGATASGDSGKAGPGVNGNAGPGVSSTGVSFFSAATFDVGSTATLFLMAMASGAVVNELVARTFCLQGTFCFQGGIDTDFAKGVGGVARAVAACVRDVTAEFAAMAAGVGAVSAGVGAGIFRRGSADVAAEVAGSSVAAGAAAGDGAIVAAGAGSRVGVSTLTSTGVAGIILVPLGFARGIKTKPALFLLCPDRCGRCSYGGNGRSMVLLRLRLLAARSLPKPPELAVPKRFASLQRNLLSFPARRGTGLNDMCFAHKKRQTPCLKAPPAASRVLSQNGHGMVGLICCRVRTLGPSVALGTAP